MAKVYAGSYLPSEQHGAKIKPERIIGYELEVFSYNGLFWHTRRKNYLVPGGMLKSVTRLDIGDLVADFFLSTNIPRGFSYAHGKALFPGTKSKAKPYLLPKEMREFEQFADLNLLYYENQLIYHFELRKDCITVNLPLEFKVGRYISESYGSEEETITYDTSDRIVPWFRKQGKNNVPDPRGVSLVVHPEVTDLNQN